MRKTICIISNILLSSLYISTSWMVSAAALFYLVAIGWNLSSVPQLLWVVGIGLIALTPVFCILGIVLSAIQCAKEHYAASFLVQFLPFVTIGVSIVLFLAPVWVEALM